MYYLFILIKRLYRQNQSQLKCDRKAKHMNNNNNNKPVKHTQTKQSKAKNACAISET